MSKARYFIFFYTGLNNSRSATGWFDCFNEPGVFPKRSYLVARAAKQSGMQIKHVAITGWKEMPKEDYHAYLEIENASCID